MKIILPLLVSLALLEAMTRILQTKFPIQKYHFLKSYWAENRYFYYLNRQQSTTQSASPASNFDPLLGWRNKREPSVVSAPPVKLNSGLWRSPHEFEVKKNKKRIAIVGDSFSYGVGLSDGNTYPDYLSKEFSGDYEVYNFGVAGFGLDQMAINAVYNVAPYHPDLIVFSFIADNFSRACFNFVFNARKPYFEKKSGDLVLSATPVPSPTELMEQHAPLARKIEDGLKALLLESKFISLAGHAVLQSKFLNCYNERGAEIMTWMREKLPKDIPVSFFHLDGELTEKQIQQLHLRQIDFVSLPPLVESEAKRLGLSTSRLPDGHPDKELNAVYASLMATHLKKQSQFFP